MANTFGEARDWQTLEKEGGGFYSTVSADIVPDVMYKPNSATNLFGFCAEKCYAGGRYWFTNMALGQTIKRDRPANWTSVEGQKVYLTDAGVLSVTATGNTLVGWEVDTEFAKSQTNEVKVCIFPFA